MKRLILLSLTGIVFFGCRDSERALPIRAILELTDLKRDSNLNPGEITITGNLSEVTKVVESEYKQRNGKVIEVSRYLLSGDIVSEKVPELKPPIDNEIREQSYMFVYDTVMALGEFLRSRGYDQFFSMTVSGEHPVTSLMFNKLSVRGQTLNLRYYYDSGRMIIVLPFLDKKDVAQLRSLFPKAEFRDRKSDTQKAKQP